MTKTVGMSGLTATTGVHRPGNAPTIRTDDQTGTDEQEQVCLFDNPMQGEPAN
ncbi:MAG: hypothetical protein HGB02_00795 [Chlorobiaceae bacterium]|nr:hypothetical protein [Chlorobiaceae bacterium]